MNKEIIRRIQQRVALVLCVTGIVVYLCARDIVAGDQSLLLPSRAPSELLMPAIESALFGPNSPTPSHTSFLQSQSFEVRDASSTHVRRLKSAARPDAAVKPVLTPAAIPTTIPATPTTLVPYDTLQYEPRGLFALRLVTVTIPAANVPKRPATPLPNPPVPNPLAVSLPNPLAAERAENSKQTLSAPVVARPVSLVIPGSFFDPGMNETPAARPMNSLALNAPVPDIPMQGNSANQANARTMDSSALVLPPIEIASETKSKTIPEIIPETNQDRVRKQASALAAAGTVTKSDAPAKRPEIAANIRPDLPAPRETEQVPVPEVAGRPFDLSSVTMEYMNSGASIQDQRLPQALPVPSAISEDRTPWFERLPKDDFFIGFDNKALIGMARSGEYNPEESVSLPESPAPAPQDETKPGVRVPLPENVTPLPFENVTQQELQQQVQRQQEQLQ